MPAEALTAARVEQLKRTPPAVGRLEVWDSKVPGLCLRISATGAASWSLRYRPRGGGCYQRITLGSARTLVLADARTRASRLKLEVADGGDPQGDRVARRHAANGALTFDAVAQRYLDEYARPNKASWKFDVSRLRRVRAVWGTRAIASITDDDAAVLLDEIAATAPVGANRTQSVLHKLFIWAKEPGRKFVVANPLAGLRRRTRERPRERVLDDDELAALLRVLSQEPEFPADRPAILALMALILTGQRSGEVAGAVRRELRLDHATWEIPAERTKARRAQVVPLAPMALAVFGKAVAGGSERVFALASHNSLRIALRRALQRAGTRSLIEDPPVPHDLRRTVATGLAALGIPREDRVAVLAHAASDVHGRVYDKYSRLKEKRAALEKWERHVAALIGG
jgi:integrase